MAGDGSHDGSHRANGEASYRLRPRCGARRSATNELLPGTHFEPPGIDHRLGEERCRLGCPRWENPRKLRQTWVSVPRCRGNLQRPGAENHRFMVKKPARENRLAITREQTGYYLCVRVPILDVRVPILDVRAPLLYLSQIC
jgi:hypothetical protein